MHASLDGSRARRASPRLAEFDYSQESYYFVTICTRNHKSLFGQIRNDKIYLSPTGEIVASEWCAIPDYEPHTHLDAWVVMPNHLHGIISIHAAEHEDLHDLSAIVSAFKSRVTWSANRVSRREGASFWQRSFYDHVIRNDDDLERIQEYIENNPGRWGQDRFHR